MKWITECFTHIQFQFFKIIHASQEKTVCVANEAKENGIHIQRSIGIGSIIERQIIHTLQQ